MGVDKHTGRCYNICENFLREASMVVFIIVLLVVAGVVAIFVSSRHEAEKRDLMKNGKPILEADRLTQA